MAALTCRLCSVNGLTTAAGRDGLCSAHRSRPADRGLYDSLGSGFDPDPPSPRTGAALGRVLGQRRFAEQMSRYAAYRDSGKADIEAASLLGISLKWARARYEPAYAEMRARRGDAA